MVRDPGCILMHRFIIIYESFSIYESIRDTTEKQATQLCSCCKSPVVQYQTRSPVVLMGHGADELFGGYGRHATAGRYDGSKGARNEMIVSVDMYYILRRF